MPPGEDTEREYILPDGETHRMTIYDAAGEWLAHLDTAGEIEAGFGVSVCNRYNSKTDIMNAGAGAASVLPVIFTGLLSEEGEYLVFEHPESCLHPYAQSRLADLFAALVRAGRKIIVETHSETLLLRLRYLVLAEKINAGDIAVDFFRNDHDGSALVSRGCISQHGTMEYPPRLPVRDGAVDHGPGGYRVLQKKEVRQTPQKNSRAQETVQKEKEKNKKKTEKKKKEKNSMSQSAS